MVGHRRGSPPGEPRHDPFVVCRHISEGRTGPSVKPGHQDMEIKLPPSTGISSEIIPSLSSQW